MKVHFSTAIAFLSAVVLAAPSPDPLEFTLSIDDHNSGLGPQNHPPPKDAPVMWPAGPVGIKLFGINPGSSVDRLVRNDSATNGFAKVVGIYPVLVPGVANCIFVNDKGGRFQVASQKFTNTLTLCPSPQNIVSITCFGTETLKQG
ncbi:MAG: hypothetical protein Q9222_006326 [Ikaeria aurantiellina]